MNRYIYIQMGNFQPALLGNFQPVLTTPLQATEQRPAQSVRRGTDRHLPGLRLQWSQRRGHGQGYAGRGPGAAAITRTEPECPAQDQRSGRSQMGAVTGRPGTGASLPGGRGARQARIMQPG